MSFSAGEIVFYSIVTLCNLIIVTEWAKKGFLETGLKVTPKTLLAVLVGMGTVCFFGYNREKYGINYENYYAIIPIIGLPILWFLIYRYLIVPSGYVEFSKAKARMNFWMQTSFEHGRILEDKGLQMKESPLVLKTIEIFKKAIEEQKRGTKTSIITKERTLQEDDADFGRVQVRCPSCGINIYVDSRVLGEGVTGPCHLCGSFVSVRLMRGIIYTTCNLQKARYLVTDINNYNIAVAYEEMAMLYRMMNDFKEAEECLNQAENFISELLKKQPENHEYLNVQSMIIFRRAEIEQAHGDIEPAKQKYLESLAIDEKTGSIEGAQTIRKILAMMEV